MCKVSDITERFLQEDEISEQQVIINQALEKHGKWLPIKVVSYRQRERYGFIETEATISVGESSINFDFIGKKETFGKGQNEWSISGEGKQDISLETIAYFIMNTNCIKETTRYNIGSHGGIAFPEWLFRVFEGYLYLNEI